MRKPHSVAWPAIVKAFVRIKHYFGIGTIQLPNGAVNRITSQNFLSRGFDLSVGALHFEKARDPQRVADVLAHNTRPRRFDLCLGSRLIR